MKIIVIILFTFITSNSFAQSVNFCPEEIKLHCPNEKDPPQMIKCLMKENSNLSTQCKEDLQRFIQNQKGAMGRGGGSPSAFGGMMPGGAPTPIIIYEGRHSNKNSAPSLFENKFNFSTPIYGNASESYSTSVALAELHFGNESILNNGIHVASKLYRSEVGVQYSKRLPEKRNWGIKFSVGHSGDGSITSSKDAALSLNAHYGFPSSSGSGFWMLGVFVTNNGSFANYIPLPGVMYGFRTTDFNALIGFPITSLQWTPVFPWGFSFTVFGLAANLEATYGAPDKMQFFTGFYMNRQTFIPDNRTDDKYRLTFAENKTAIGIRTPFLSMLKAEFQIGKATHRSLYIGKGYMNKDGGSKDLESTTYASWNFRLAF